ncbi:MAG: TonB-dependent receptor [bacterium]|nr:TonB-dependent receptor [bacterium]
MEKMKIVITILLFLIVVSCVSTNADIVETVEVEGRVFSQELLHSRNMVIISSTDLEEMKIKNMADLFSFFTAVNVSKRGASESSFDITMRGGNFEQVLMLVNGVPQNNPQTGHFNSDFAFSIPDVERVEILRGGSSTTYGAGAFAGVVNIILKKDSPFRVSAITGGNRFFSGTMQAGKKFKNLSLRFSLDKSKSDGFYEGREFDRLKLTAGGFYSANDLEIDVQTGYLKKDFGAQDFYAPFPSTEEIESYYCQLKLHKTSGNIDYSLTYSYNRHDDFFVLDRDRPTYYSNESITGIHYLNISGTFEGKKLNATVGFDVKGESMDSLSMGDRKRNGGAFYLNMNYRFTNRTGIDAGVRRNIIKSNPGGGDSNFIFYSGLYRRLGGGIILKGGYSKSFRLPSFTELYYNSPANQGDEGLQPEFSHNFEASFSVLKPKYQLDLSVFYRNQENVIDWVKHTGAGFWQAVNLEQNDIAGVELTQRFQIKRSHFMLGIERLGVSNKKETTGFVSKYGLRFPDFSVKLNVIQPLGKRLKAAVNYTYKQIYDTEEQGHFMNLVLSVPVGPLEISLRVDNVFNEIIEEIPGLKVPGRWAYVGLVYNMN